MPEYKVNTPVKVRGEIHKSGTVECSDKVAAPLLATGALSQVEESSNSDITDDQLKAFNDAVAKLDKGKEQLWLNDGRPDVKALEAVGVKVSAKERDAAWKKMQDGQGQ